MFGFFHPKTQAKIYMTTSITFFICAGLLDAVLSSGLRNDEGDIPSRLNNEADRCEALIDQAYLHEHKIKATCISLVGNLLSSWACMEPHSRSEIARDISRHGTCRDYIENKYPPEPPEWQPTQSWGLR